MMEWRWDLKEDSWDNNEKDKENRDKKEGSKNGPRES